MLEIALSVYKLYDVNYIISGLKHLKVTHLSILNDIIKNELESPIDDYMEVIIDIG